MLRMLSKWLSVIWTSEFVLSLKYGTQISAENMKHDLIIIVFLYESWLISNAHSEIFFQRSIIASARSVSF